MSASAVNGSVADFEFDNSTVSHTGSRLHLRAQKLVRRYKRHLFAGANVHTVLAKTAAASS